LAITKTEIMPETTYRAAVAPTIATAFYQSTAVANEYSTLGYLVCIVTILGFPIMPRAKFIQTMMINLLAISFGGALALFAIWTGIKARQHTLPADSTPTGYNSSASAVCGLSHRERFTAHTDLNLQLFGCSSSSMLLAASNPPGRN